MAQRYYQRNQLKCYRAKTKTRNSEFFLTLLTPFLMLFKKFELGVLVQSENENSELGVFPRAFTLHLLSYPKKSDVSFFVHDKNENSELGLFLNVPCPHFSCYSKSLSFRFLV